MKRLLVTLVPLSMVVAVSPLASARSGPAPMARHHPEAVRAPAAPSPQDRTFAEEVARGARFETLGGMAARANAGRADVRAFGERMIRDHSRQYADLAVTARRVGIAVGSQPDREQRQIVKLFNQLHGGAFDCAYIPTEYLDHQGDVVAFQGELSRGQDLALRSFASRWLPVLVAHREQARIVLDSMQTCA